MVSPIPRTFSFEIDRGNHLSLMNLVASISHTLLESLPSNAIFPAPFNWPRIKYFQALPRVGRVDVTSILFTNRLECHDWWFFLLVSFLLAWWRWPCAENWKGHIAASTQHIESISWSIELATMIVPYESSTCIIGSTIWSTSDRACSFRLLLTLCRAQTAI